MFRVPSLVSAKKMFVWKKKTSLKTRQNFRDDQEKGAFSSYCKKR